MKRILLALALLLLALCGAFAYSKSRTSQLFGVIVSRVETREKVVALTFDDGPTDYAAGEILRDLGDVKATFFLIGANMKECPSVAPRLVAAGHQLGNHTWSHNRMLLKSPSYIAREIESTDALIRAAGWRGPILFRAPYSKKLVGLPWYLWRHDRIDVMFDVEPESDSRTDQHIWADRYDRKLEDVFALQSELAETVAREIAVQLTPDVAAQMSKRGPVNPEAHLEYLKGRHSYFAATAAATELGLRHVRRALELDPNLALAWSALAECLMFRAVRGMSPPGETVAEATVAANRALAIDSMLAEAHASLGFIRMHAGDAASGLTSLRRAIELNPGLAFAHNMLARTLASYERHAEALAAANTSVQLDPLSTLIRTGVGDAITSPANTRNQYFIIECPSSSIHASMARTRISRVRWRCWDASMKRAPRMTKGAVCRAASPVRRSASRISRRRVGTSRRLVAFSPS